jgi:hypothetical protein
METGVAHSREMGTRALPIEFRAVGGGHPGGYQIIPHIRIPHYRPQIHPCRAVLRQESMLVTIDRREGGYLSMNGLNEFHEFRV